MSTPPPASDRVAPQQALQQARAARIAAETPREPESPLRFRSAKHLREHVAKHVFDLRDGPWWHRLIGRELARAARDAPAMAAHRPAPDEGDPPPDPAAVAAASAAFKQVAEGYQALLSDRLAGLCAAGVGHIHLLTLDYDGAWQISGTWQKVVAWDPDGNLVIIAGSSVTEAGAGRYLLLTGHRRDAAMSRGLFLKDMRRWAQQHARERGLTVLAMHDGPAPGESRRVGTGAT